MPKKSIREMKKWELRANSLEARVFRLTLYGAIVLGLVMLVIGLGLYIVSLGNRYIKEAYDLAKSTEVIVGDRYDLEDLTTEVLSTYRGLTEEERSATGTEKYRKSFSWITERPEFKELQADLNEMRESSGVSFVYVAYYDRKTQALVYVCDSDTGEATSCYPGEWETVEKRELDRFLNWDNESKHYDISHTKRYGWMCTAGVPVKNGKGEIVSFVLADVTLGNLVRAVRLFILQYTVAFLVIVAILGLVLTRRMKKAVVDPINEIADAAKNYVEDRQNGINTSDYFSNLNIRTGDEVENLSLVMADMEQGMAEYERNLTRVTAENERIGTELALATRIQTEILPNTFPAFPDRTEFDIYATMIPAREVGGDFYDFFLVDEDHLALVIADVSGKGIPAALFMMSSRTILKNNAMHGRSPAETLEGVNRAVCDNNSEDMFVTAWFGLLEISTGKLTAANAGHEYPAIMKPGGSFELFKDRHGIVIGGMDSTRYKEYEMILEPGTKLFLYTDGVPEASNADKKMFGTERMLEALNQDKDAHPMDILEEVQLAVDHFVEQAEQFDDLTMLCVEYNGKGVRHES